MEKFEYGLLGSKLDELINVPDHSIRYLDGKKVSTVLLFNQGQILAVSRKDDPNDFGLPGGKLDPGETFTAGAIREVREETGLHIFGLIHQLVNLLVVLGMHLQSLVLVKIGMKLLIV